MISERSTHVGGCEPGDGGQSSAEPSRVIEASVGRDPDISSGKNVDRDLVGGRRRSECLGLGEGYADVGRNIEAGPIRAVEHAVVQLVGRNDGAGGERRHLRESSSEAGDQDATGSGAPQDSIRASRVGDMATVLVIGGSIVY